MAKRRKKSRKKTYRKKSSAKKAGGSVYKVKGGWRVSRGRKRRKR